MWPAWLRQAQEEPRLSLDSVSMSKPAKKELCFRCPCGPGLPALHCHLPVVTSFPPTPPLFCTAPLTGLCYRH